MSESFVDLSYRGLPLGRRVKLTQVRPTTGYVEMPAPMPVGTPIAIATDDGVEIAAVVSEVHEQVGGSDRAPGMIVTPALDGAAAAWWKQRAEAAPPSPPPIPKPQTVPPPIPALKADPGEPSQVVTVTSRRLTAPGPVPELMDDGRNTAVMDAVDESGDDAEVDKVVADVAPDPAIQDDGKRTVAMDAVDLQALGLDPSTSSNAMKAITDEDSGNGKKKKKRKR